MLFRSTIELAMKKEFSVLGIEAHDIGRQHMNSEIRCELRNVFAVELRMAVPVFARHEVRTRTLYHRCKEYRPAARAL